jgi:hypothetical protein
MEQSQSCSFNYANLRKVMVCHRRMKVVSGMVRCLSDVLRLPGLVWRYWFPSSVEVICESCFSSCDLLASVTFEANSRLSRLKKLAFSESELQLIHLPNSLEVICEGSFLCCESLTSVTFDPGSRICASVSDLRAGIPFDCCSSNANLNARTGGDRCSVS